MIGLFQVFKEMNMGNLSAVSSSVVPQTVNNAQAQQAKNDVRPYAQQAQDGRVFRFGGQNAATADQANSVRVQSEDKVLQLSKREAELTEQISSKKAWLDRDWKEHWGNYVFDPLGVGYWTKEFKQARSIEEGKLQALETQLSDIKKLKETRHDSVKTHSETDAKGLSSNLVPQSDRLKKNKADNIVAANQNRGTFAF